MTKYILCGGKDRHYPAFGRALSAEISKTHDKAKWLSCFFAVPKEEWQDEAKSWEAWLRQTIPQVHSFDYARTDSFLEQIEEADIICLHSGDNATLLESLKQFEHLEQHFKNKIIIGMSAGSNALSSKYWSSTYRKPGQGFSIVNANIMVHFGVSMMRGSARTAADWGTDRAAFQAYIGPKEKVTTLPEGGFKVYEVEG